MDNTEPNSLESQTLSFVIKLWVEEAVDETSQVVWRGYITHAPNEQRRYLKDLNDIIAFIAPYLKQGGVKFS